MPFLIPVAAAFAVGAVGAGIGGATLAGALIVGAIDAAVTLGTSLLLQAVTPKPKDPGQQLGVSLNPAQPRVVLFGQTATSGSLVTFQTWGSSNENLILVFALADHECDSLVGGWWMGERMTINPDGSVQQAYQDGKYHLWVRFYPGKWDDQIDPTLLANSGGRWNPGPWGRGVCKVVVQAHYNQQAHPQGLAGLFQFVWEVRGAKLYDRRGDSTVGGSGGQRADRQETWAWSNNAAVVAENLLRGFRAEDTTQLVLSERKRDVLFGLNLTDADLPFAQNAAAMNNCDEPVSQLNNGSELSNPAEQGVNQLYLTSTVGLTAGLMMTVGVGKATQEVHEVQAVDGLTVTLLGGLAYAHTNGEEVSWTNPDGSSPLVPRYTLNGNFTVDNDRQTVLQNMLQGMGDARLLTGAGVNYVLLPGVARTSVARPDGQPGPTIIDADLRLDGPHKFQQYQQLDQIPNAVYGRWSDPNAYYQGNPLPARISTADEDEDGGKKDVTFDVIWVTSSSQGQRCQEIHRRRQRAQMQAQICLPPRYLCLEGGDWVDWQSDRYGFVATFEVQNARWVLDDDKNLLGVVVDLQEITPETFDWDPDVDELSLTNPQTLPSADPVAATIAGFNVTAVAIGDPSSGAQIPALVIQWNNVVDIYAVSVLVEWRVHGQPETASQTFSTVVPVNPSTSDPAGTTTVTVAGGVNSGLLYEARAVVQTNPLRLAVYTDWTEANTVTPGTYVAISSEVPWGGVFGTGKPADFATVGATVGDNLYGPSGVLQPTDVITILGTANNVLNLGEYTVEQAVETLNAAVAKAAQLFAEVDSLATSAIETALQGLQTQQYVDEQTHVDGDSLVSYMSLLAVMRADKQAVDLQLDKVVIDPDTGETIGDRLTLLQATDASNSAALATEVSVRTSAVAAVASSLSSLSTTVAGHTASITAMQSSINGLLLKWSVTLDANGKISGVVFNNDGTTSSTAFIDDLFVIGAATGTFTFQPFTYDATSGRLYLYEIVAHEGIFDDLTLGGKKLSLNAVTNSAIDIGSLTYGVGVGSMVLVGSCSITVDEPGAFFIHTSWTQAQDGSHLLWEFSIDLDGGQVAGGGFNLAQGLCSSSVGAFLDVGVHTAQLFWSGPSTSYCQSPVTLFIAMKK